ncbi:hypothetical protein MTR67_022875 [Solanum verrucosum]|uniref:Uncharacterized protein n=1 Tax=Solanum verrucosum TaxID=315347 RepID=A0AAF0QYN2_SOLVR|nr:hypothetical protein MTR67_022875 [Solanum verrucosum]
MNMPHPAV